MNWLKQQLDLAVQRANPPGAAEWNELVRESLQRELEHYRNDRSDLAKQEAAWRLEQARHRCVAPSGSAQAPEPVTIDLAPDPVAMRHPPARVLLRSDSNDSFSDNDSEDDEASSQGSAEASDSDVSSADSVEEL